MGGVTMKQQYDSYKPSGIDWIGDIPSPWQIVRIKNIISLLTDYDANGSFSDIASNCKINEGIPYAWMVRATDLENKRYGIVEGNNYCDISTYYYLSKSSLVKDDILIAKRGDIGKSYLVPNCDSPMTLAPNTYLLKTLKNLINNRYFFYYLQSSSGKESLRLENKSTTLGALYKDDVKRIPIPLPPLAEQEVIAEWLDDKCGEIDAAIAKVDREIELIDELKQSEISRVVTRGLNPDTPLRPSGIDWIGDIPSHWTVMPVKYVLDNLDYLRQPISAEDRERNNPQYDYYGASGVIDQIDYYNVEDTVLLIGEDGANLVMRNLPLIYKASGKFWVNNHAHILKPQNGYDYSYLAHLLEAGDYTLFITGSAQPKLSQENLNKYPICVPPLAEQQAIADYLDKKCAEIDGLKAKLSKKRETLTELRQSIISEVVTGKRKVI